MWLRSSSISLDGYGSKIRKVRRCRLAVSNEIILRTRQEFFFTKVAPVLSINDIVLLDIWLMLLSWMFISSCTTIHFFLKIFIFSNISVNRIFECLYMFFDWERDHQLSTYATVGGMGGAIQNACSCVKGDGLSRLMCTYALTLSLFMHFYLIVFCLNFTLPLFKKDVLFRNGCFSPTRSVFVVVATT